MKMNKYNTGYFILTILAIVGKVGIFILPPFEQKEEYHEFCDSHACYSIPNFWNVISNLPLLLVGIIGLYKVKKMTGSKLQFFIFFLSISPASLGLDY